MRKQRDVMPTQKAIPPRRLSSPSTGGKNTTCACWSLKQHLLQGGGHDTSFQLHVLLAGDRGPGDPDSTGTHHPTELGQGGSAVPKALETPAVPQNRNPPVEGGRSSHLNTAQ